VNKHNQQQQPNFTVVKLWNSGGK